LAWLLNLVETFYISVSLLNIHGAMASTSHTSSTAIATIIVIITILICSLIVTIGLLIWKRRLRQRSSTGSKVAGYDLPELYFSPATNRSLEPKVRGAESSYSVEKSVHAFSKQPQATHALFRGKVKRQSTTIAKTFLGIDNASFLRALVAHQGIYKSNSTA
jgi:hypothetical protein